MYLDCDDVLRIETLNELKATSTELWKEATLARDDAETQREELRNELISLRAEKAKLGEETNRLVKRNKELLAVEYVFCRILFFLL